MIRIFNYKKKASINIDLIKPPKRILRLLRIDKSDTSYIIGQVENDQENVSEAYRKEIRNGTLQADYTKAHAVMTMQNRRFN